MNGLEAKPFTNLSSLHKIGGGQHRDVEEIKRQQKNKLTRHSFTITRKIMIWFSRLTFLYIKSLLSR